MNIGGSWKGNYERQLRERKNWDEGKLTPTPKVIPDTPPRSVQKNRINTDTAKSRRIGGNWTHRQFDTRKQHGSEYRRNVEGTRQQRRWYNFQFHRWANGDWDFTILITWIVYLCALSPITPCGVKGNASSGIGCLWIYNTVQTRTAGENKRSLVAL